MAIMDDLAAQRASVVILAYNKAQHTARCLNGLLHTSWRPLEVVLLDNGSTDGIPDVFDSFEERAGNAEIHVKRLRNESNLGAATGRNQALERASGRLVAFMDNDVVVRSRDWIERLARTLASHDKAGIAGPKLIYPFPPFLIQCAGGAVSPTGRVFFRGRGEPNESPRFGQEEEVQCLISACWLMRRDVFEDVGGLDEAYNPVQFEDIDFCYKARAAGWRVFYNPAAEMYHFENVTTSGSPTINSPYQIVKNGLLFKRRWQHAYSREAGPREEDWHWAEIPTVRLDSIGPLEMTGGTSARETSS
ncbi:MAG: glycosyltransferase family 2 protein [Planctomycetota bacterium]